MSITTASVYLLSVFLLWLDGDDATDLEWCKKQIMTTKFWPDDNNDKPWKKDLSMTDYQILLVSQFTLYAKVYKVCCLQVSVFEAICTDLVSCLVLH
jgi:D-Tyr-tRNAtyr deacylase